ncbi:MAG TPA: PAS domain S-box protein [Terriglobales bacterium]|nr:PAS domain S-box protein [Terriglobales bacterium]
MDPAVQASSRGSAAALLERGREFWEALIEDASDMIWVHDLAGNFLAANRLAREFAGYGKQDVRRLNIAHLLPAEQLAMVQERIARRMSGQPLPGPFEVEMVARDGRRLTVEVNPRPLYVDGKLAGMQGIAHDITDRKRAEEALRRSEEKFRALAETAACGIFIYQDTRFRYVNALTEAITGYTREELLRTSFLDLVHPDLRELARERALARQRGQPVPSRYEIKILTKTGEVRWLDYTAGMIDYEGGPAVLGTAFDITDRKRANEALQQSEERYRSFVTQSSEGIRRYEIDPPMPTNLPEDEQIRCLFENARLAECNDALARDYGFDFATEMLGKRIADLMPPADPHNVERLRSFIREGYRTLEAESHDVDRYGNTIYVLNNSTGIVENGRLVRIWGTQRDISDRRRTEQALRESEAKFRAVADTAASAIYIHDGQRFLYANRASERISGYAAEELMQMSPWALVREDYRGVVEERAAQRQQGQPVTSRYEFPIITKSGEVRWLDFSASTIQFGGEAAILATAFDVTERRRAEQLQSALYRIAETASSAPTLDELYASIHAILGELMYAKNCYIALHDESTNTVRFPYFVDQVDQPPSPRPFGKGLTEYVMRTGQPLLATRQEIEELARRGVAEQVGSRSLDWMGVPLKRGEQAFGVLALQTYEPNIRFGEPEKEVLTFVSHQIARAIEAKTSQEAMRESESKFRTVTETARALIYIHDEQRFLYANPVAEEITGYTRDDLLSRRPADLLHPDDRDLMLKRAARLLRGESIPAQQEFRILTQTGRVRWLESSTGIIQYGGRPAILSTAVDVTERKRAEQLQQALYRIASQASSAADLERFYAEVHGIVGELMDARNFYIALYDAPSQTIHFPYFVDEQDVTPPRMNVGRGLTAYVLRTGQPLLATPEVFTELVRQGEVDEVGAPSVDWLGVPLKQGETNFGVLVVQSYDEHVRYGERDKDILTFVSQQVASAIEHKRSQEALRRSEASYRSLFASAAYGICRSLSDGRILDANPAMVEMLRYGSASELLRLNMATDVYADPGEGRACLEQFTQGARFGPAETKWKCKDGRVITVRLSGRSVPVTPAGPPVFEMFAEDVTERRALEEQLRQSQKMEAVGRLAGGIAHDFNNLLTVIQGYTELLLERVQGETPMRTELDEIAKAAERATSLTRQLLAFSRQQVLEPKVLDLNTVVGAIEQLLRRLLGEDIALYAHLASDLGRVRADPGQVEQVIMNLAVNSRDAMPRGGKLVIETANVELDSGYAHEHPTVKPGPYVMLAVSDTGVGMDEETRARVFEPFFTTKEKGKGTGLGLATVYGIVKQSDGYIWVYSEPGRGTTVKVYLPRVDEPAPPGALPTAVPARYQGTETVLLVEDEEGVRALVRRVLDRHGYRVLEARHGGEALALCARTEEPIDLLLTDVILEQMSGPELAARLSPLRPKLKVLYMSGYTDDAIGHHGVLAAGTEFLQKPFSTEALVRKVRQVLDSADGSAR